MRKLIILIAIYFTLTSCEDPVEVDYSDSANVISIDAILNNLNESQTISVIRTGSYFEQNSIQRISEADVRIVRDDGKEYQFEHTNDGKYLLPGSEVDFSMDFDYTLFVELGSDTFSANTSLRRVPEIDSIVWRKESVAPFGIDVDSIIFAQFYATDLPGTGDRYWVRGFRNDSLINREGFNRAWDASPGAGVEFDNLPFAQPIRQVVTPNGTEFGEILERGDKISVKLYSISQELSNFFQILTEQINNGGLFATPPANVPTNLTNLRTGEKGLGWFEICNTSTDSARIDKVPGNNRIE